ncbi:MAG: hypothetical protein JWR90_1397 [Marmoricola sp.]|jgi:hypothetical protein|nr:hypothetical protein [Marmoricola sp.]
MTEANGSRSGVALTVTTPRPPTGSGGLSSVGAAVTLAITPRASGRWSSRKLPLQGCGGRPTRTRLIRAVLFSGTEVRATLVPTPSPMDACDAPTPNATSCRPSGTSCVQHPFLLPNRTVPARVGKSTRQHCGTGPVKRLHLGELRGSDGPVWWAFGRRDHPYTRDQHDGTPNQSLRARKGTVRQGARGFGPDRGHNPKATAPRQPSRRCARG